MAVGWDQRHDGIEIMIEAAGVFRTPPNRDVDVAQLVDHATSRNPGDHNAFCRRANLSHMGNQSGHELRHVQSTAPITLQIVPDFVVEDAQNRPYTDSLFSYVQNLRLTWFWA
jgi:hypothetical protein